MCLLILCTTCWHSLRHSHPVLAHARSLSPSRLAAQGTPTFGSPFSSSVVHDRLMHLFFPLYRRSCSLIPWCFGTPLTVQPTVVVLLWTSFSLRPFSQLASLSLAPLCCTPALLRPHVVLLSSKTFPRLLCLPFQPIRPCPAVHDWSTVVAACHHWLHPVPDFPVRASVLDSLFDSFTRILCGCASHHCRRRPGSRPRTRQPSGGMMRQRLMA